MGMSLGPTGASTRGEGSRRGWNASEESVADLSPVQPRSLCSTAKHEYGLTDRELARLPYQEVKNPNYK